LDMASPHSDTMTSQPSLTNSGKPGAVQTEVDPKGWTKFGRRLDGAAG
jgi:hypothetical protein